MNIYFACSITGGRAFEPVYQAIIAALLADGHTIPTAALARPDVIEREAIVSPRAVYERDINWIKGCDALVAEVSTPSHGVGYEVAYALSLGKPVLCLYQAGQAVSKMITGNSQPALRVRSYQNTEEAIAVVRSFVSPE
ncbi:MAG TPA: nucleoside 2-deoxyribosyltransferase [Anaerolineales bacterium]|nr:nucleoside 2-deoxyribosyltransferase [Anaerolineales bacterium]